jgi:hypothetical protein
MRRIGGQGRKTWLIALVVCLLALCLAACGAESEASRLGKSVTAHSMATHGPIANRWPLQVVGGA